MLLLNPSLTVPLEGDSQAVLWVAGKRLPLDSVLRRYLQGDSPQDIQDSFPSLSLGEIYALIAYYHDQRPLLDAYLARRRAESEQHRALWESENPPISRSTLEARLK
jgi:uncharacterized protein (DUF433 family)